VAGGQVSTSRKSLKKAKKRKHRGPQGGGKKRRGKGRGDVGKTTGNTQTKTDIRD